MTVLPCPGMSPGMHVPDACTCAAARTCPMRAPWPLPYACTCGRGPYQPGACTCPRHRSAGSLLAAGDRQREAQADHREPAEPSHQFQPAGRAGEP